MGTYETSIYTAVLTTALVLGCIIAYFAVSVYKQQRRHISLQRRFFADEVNQIEKEKIRIAHDLHDEVGPLLSLSKSHIHQLNPTDDKEALHVAKASEHLDKVMERMGQIAINITPRSLFKKGLHFSIEQFLNELADAYALKIAFLYDVSSLIDQNSRLHIYRIVQEIAHNTVKHSGGTELRVQIKEYKQILYLFCRDNGKGFSPANINDQEGHGRGSIRNRCEILQGKMKFHSDAGGTEYFFEIPLNY
jgi:two-component system, NarL family, sensor kinase